MDLDGFKRLAHYQGSASSHLINTAFVALKISSLKKNWTNSNERAKKLINGVDKKYKSNYSCWLLLGKKVLQCYSNAHF